MAIINGTNGNDNLRGVPGESNILNLNAGNDIGVGAEIDDTLNGAQGNDLLSGGGNNPNVQGFAPANDILNGDEGQDTLTGGIFTRLPNGQLVDSRDISGVVILNAGEINNGNNDDGDNAFDQIVVGGRAADGTPFNHYDQAGNADYALIDNFESGLDKIIVLGSIAQYSFGPSPINQDDDTNALFFNGELIAVIENERGLANVNDLANVIV